MNTFNTFILSPYPFDTAVRQMKYWCRQKKKIGLNITRHLIHETEVLLIIDHTECGFHFMGAFNNFRRFIQCFRFHALGEGSCKASNKFQRALNRFSRRGQNFEEWICRDFEFSSNGFSQQFRCFFQILIIMETWNNFVVRLKNSFLRRTQNLQKSVWREIFLGRWNLRIK